MEAVLDEVGVNILRYLKEDELNEVSRVSKSFCGVCESVLIWRCLLASFNPRSNKDSLKSVRVRTNKPRPLLKPSEKKQVFETSVTKQWIFIPPDLEKQIKVITINKAGQLRKNEEFKSRCFQLLETWSESMNRTVSILESHELRGDFDSPYSAIIIWKDKQKVLEDLLSELNDVCVAKVDAVFSGLKPHKQFISQLERVKRHHREAKVRKKQEIWTKFSKIENLLKEMTGLLEISKSLSQVLSYLQDIITDEIWENRSKKVIFSLIQKFISSVEAEGNFNKIFKSSDFQLLNQIKKSGSLFISCKLLTGNEKIRPSTSYQKPITKNPEDLLIQILHIMTVASELSEMLEKLKNNDFSPQVFKIYAEVPVEFEIWKHENQVFWARLVQAFFERIKERPKQQVFVESDEESVEDSDHFVVARWTIN